MTITLTFNTYTHSSPSKDDGPYSNNYVPSPPSIWPLYSQTEVLPCSSGPVIASIALGTSGTSFDCAALEPSATIFLLTSILIFPHGTILYARSTHSLIHVLSLKPFARGRTIHALAVRALCWTLCFYPSVPFHSMPRWACDVGHSQSCGIRVRCHMAALVPIPFTSGEVMISDCRLQVV